MHCRRLGVVVALDAEAQALHAGALRHDVVVEVNAQILLVVSGMGPERAMAAARTLLAAGVDGLVSWGTAGALQPARKPGDLLLPEVVFGASSQTWSVDLAWREILAQSLSLPAYAGGLLSVATPCGSVAAKSACLLDFPLAQGVDMESGAIAAVADAAGKPFVVIRSIVDPADQSLPDAATGSVDAYGGLQVLKLMRGLLRHPAVCVDLMRLGAQMQKALNTLRAVAPSLQAGRVA